MTLVLLWWRLAYGELHEAFSHSYRGRLHCHQLPFGHKDRHGEEAMMGDGYLDASFDSLHSFAFLQFFVPTLRVVTIPELHFVRKVRRINRRSRARAGERVPVCHFIPLLPPSPLSPLPSPRAPRRPCSLAGRVVEEGEALSRKGAASLPVAVPGKEEGRTGRKEKEKEKIEMPSVSLLT